MKNNLTSYNSSIYSYDLVKCIACIMMILDHIGLFFVHDSSILRIIGRFSFPLFFFITGYKKAFSVSFLLFLGASILSIVIFFSSLPLFPLNALWSMIISRLLFHLLLKRDLLQTNIWGICMFLLICFPVTNIFWEYGSFGLLFMMLGYERKNRTTFSLYLLFFSWISYFVAECALFTFTGKDLFIFLFFICMALFFLFSFTAKNYSCSSKIIASITASISRYSLHIYVTHVSLFLLIHAHIF